MKCEQIEIPMPWGYLKGQLFGEKSNTIPILCLHGFLDNSNSFKPLAPYLTENNHYHLIAIDLPGQGLSSKIPDPLLYTIKTFIICIRQTVLHLNLKNFIFLTHSFGCTLALMYLSCFPEDVNSIILIDFVFDISISNKDLATNYRENITRLLETNSESESKVNNIELTYDKALEIILKANRHIDELSGKILLERSLKCNHEGKLEFTRDINLAKNMLIKYHHAEFMCFYSSIINNIKSPILHIYAYPYPYGEVTFNLVNELLNKIKENSNLIEIIKFEGSHHFHMIEPEKTSKIIFEFLNKKNLVNNSNSKL